MVRLRSADRIEDMVTIQQLAGRLWPGGGHHPGGLSWALAIDQLHDDICLASEAGAVVGGAGRSKGAVEVHADRSAPGATDELLGWALDGASAYLSAPVFDGDEPPGSRFLALASGPIPTSRPSMA